VAGEVNADVLAENKLVYSESVPERYTELEEGLDDGARRSNFSAPVDLTHEPTTGCGTGGHGEEIPR
jgi:hypothetical protein